MRISAGARRRGAAAAELAISLILAGIAAAIGATLLVAAERRLHREATDDHVAQTVRDASHLLGAEVSGARWDASVVRGDTAIDLQSHVAASVACVASGAVLVLPSAAAMSAASLTALRQPPEVNDVVLAWDTAGGGRWVTARADSVSSLTSGAGCPADGVFRTVAESLAHAPVTRLHLAEALPASVVRGAPVRIFRQVRWALYRGTDRAWWLGYRRCPLGACAAIQPAAGPLAAPADSGLRFALDSGGAVVVVVRAAPADRPAPIARFSIAPRGVPRGR